MVNEDEAKVYDIYSGFKKIATFEPEEDKSKKSWGKTFHSKYKKRKITQSLLLNQYFVAGCSNGHIEVYNSDTLTF